MGILGSFKTGLKLTRDSLGVLREHPELMLFPLAGGALTLAVGAVLFAGVFVGELIGSGAEYVALFVLYFVTTFLGSYFTAALVYSVSEAFHGREPSLRSGLAAAWEMKGPLAVWALIAATVGVVLERLERTDSPLAHLAASVFSLGWALTTFFVVPVIVFEDVDARGMFRKSAETFRETWGETLGAGLGVGLVQLVLGLGGLAVVVALTAVAASLGAPIGGTVGILLGGLFVVFVATYLVGQTVRGITKTALYVYAAEARVPEAFADFDFETLDGRTAREATPGTVEAGTTAFR